MALDLDLRQWPASVYPHEPVHGFFVRLAACNGSHSTRVFADFLGVNGRNFDLLELLDCCERVPSANIEALQDATPKISDGLVSINGQRLRLNSDWSIKQPRVCDACLEEASYYRNWWDIKAIHRCPIHDRPLVSGDSKSKLAWWCPNVGQLSDGRYIKTIQKERCDDHNSIDAYLLGRMGILERQDIPFADDAEMYQVLEASEFLGQLFMFGWNTKAPARFSTTSPERHRALSIGFQALRAGGTGVYGILKDYVAQRRSRAVERGAKGIFGWLLYRAGRLPNSPVAQLIASEIGRIAAEQNTSVLDWRVPKDEQRKRICLQDLARLMNTSSRTLRKVAVVLGLIKVEINRSRTHWLTEQDVQRIRSYLDDLVCREDAKKILSVSEPVFVKLRKQGVVEPATRFRGRDWFERSRLTAAAKTEGFTMITPTRTIGTRKSSTQTELLLSMHHENPDLSFKALHLKLSEMGVKIGYSTVRRFFNDRGIFKRSSNAHAT